MYLGHLKASRSSHPKESTWRADVSNQTLDALIRIAGLQSSSRSNLFTNALHVDTAEMASLKGTGW